MGYTQQDVTRDGGPSDTTQTGIELGTATGVSAATLRKIDAGLGWQPGSAKAVMDGGDPIVLDEPAEPLPVGRADHLAYLAAQITQLSADINAIARKDPALHDIAARAGEIAHFAASASFSELTGGRMGPPGYNAASTGWVEPEGEEHIAGLASRKDRSS